MRHRFNKERTCLLCGEIKHLKDFAITSHKCKPCTNANTALHRANKLGLVPKWVNDSELDLITGIYHLAYQLTKDTGIKHEVDHIYPLSKCGFHTLHNLQVIYAKDNCKKGARLPDDENALA